MKKRFACLALCLVMLLAVVLTSCGNDDGDAITDITNASSASAESLTMWVVSEKEVDAETASAVNDALNAITKSRFKVNLLVNFLTEDEYEQVLGDTIRAYEDSRNELDPSYVPIVEETQEVVTNEDGETMFVEETETNEYGVVTTKYPPFLANQVDIIYIAGKDMYLEYIDKGWLMALDSELSSSSKKIREYVSQTLLNAAKINGSTYAIPNNNAIGEYTYMLLDKELMEKNNLDGIYNQGKIDGFFNEYVFYFLDWVREHETADEVLPVAASYDYCLNLLAHYWSINPDTYDAEENTFSFLGYRYTDASTLSRGQTILSFNSLFADDVFNENYIELNRLKFDGGYFGDLADGQRAAVQFVTGDLSDYERYSEDYYPVIVKYPSVNVDDVYSNMFGVCSYSVESSRSMQIVTYLNTNADFRNILQYGVEGVHYQLVEQDGRQVVERLNEDYMMDVFKTGNAFIAYPEPTMSQDIWEVGTQQNRQALVEPLLDFDFFDVAKESGSTTTTSNPQLGTSGYTYSYTTGYSKDILSQDPILKKWIDACDATGQGVYVLHTSSASGSQNITGEIYYYNNSISGATVSVSDGNGAITVDYTGTDGSGEEFTVISYYGRKNASKLNWNANVNGTAVTTQVTYRNAVIDFDIMNTEGYEITYNPEMTKSMIYDNKVVWNWLSELTGSDPYVMRYAKQVGDQTLYTYLVYIPTIVNPYTVTVWPSGDSSHLVLDIRYTQDTSVQLGENDIQYALFAVTVTAEAEVENVDFQLSINGNSNPTMQVTDDVDPEFGMCGNLDTALVRYIYNVNAKINELLNACTSVEELETLIADLKLLLTPLTAEELLEMGSSGSDAIHTEIIANLQVQELRDYMNSLDADAFFYAIASATSYETVNHKVYGGDDGTEIEDASTNSATGEAYYYYSSPYMLYYQWLDSNGFISED